MARPVTGALTDDAYAGLLHLPRWGTGDEANGWAALLLVASVAQQLVPLDDLARDDDAGRPGWWKLVDVDQCPAFALVLAQQMVGAVCSDGLSEADHRACIRTGNGRARGTLAAMRTAVQATLTGGRQLVITERFGGAYRLKVRTYTTETPDQAATLAAILSQKPAGLVLTFEVLGGPTWDEATDTWDTSPGTWDSDTP